MKSKKYWSLLMMMFFVISTPLTFSSCGGDDDDQIDSDTEISGENGSSDSKYDANGWTTNSSMLRSASAYYIGSWYDADELSVFNVAQKQGNTQLFKTAISKALIFNQNGTGKEMSYYSGRSDSESFTWKVTKTKRPNEEIDYLVIKFNNGDTMNVAISNSSRSNVSYADRSIGYTLMDYGYEDYIEYDDWCNLQRSKSGTLSW